MLDFNKGSYFERSIDGTNTLDKKQFKVDERGNIYSLEDELLISSKQINSIIVLEEFTYIPNMEKSNSRWIAIAVGVILTLVTVFATVNLMDIEMSNIVFIAALLILYLPTIGLLGYYVTHNLLKPANQTAISYEASLDWDDQEYILLITEKDYRRILNR